MEIPYEEEYLEEDFPENFMWGAATTAYQIEGGWKADEQSAFWAYESEELPPGGEQKRTGDMYLAVHNMIKAHARVYHMYHTEFKRKQNGRVGISLRRDWYIPKDSRNPADNDAVLRNIEFDYGWVGDPIFKTGDYPVEMKNRITGSRLPTFTQREKELNKGSADFLGVSHYTTYLVSESKFPRSIPPSFYGDKDVTLSFNNDWPSPGSDWLMVYPRGIRMMLRTITKRYGNIHIFISGNGISDKTAEKNNIDRTTYIKEYTNEILKAIKLDGCSTVVGYTYSPLMDGFTWENGYNDTNGLFSIDYSSGNLSRKSTPASKSFKSMRIATVPTAPTASTAPEPEPTTMTKSPTAPSSCNCSENVTVKTVTDKDCQTIINYMNSGCHHYSCSIMYISSIALLLKYFVFP
ncbi:lactase/phlorizin hydrolase-like [Patella vulgata]|uniref:lactase/phlorizin hydrolase-like n=1 Tax=Patella vulgata TaxID=6465 RepID=UPI0024A9BFD5|nr:lactase/phlorizin hydrolase-like [Patella vulgata]